MKRAWWAASCRLSAKIVGAPCARDRGASSACSRAGVPSSAPSASTRTAAEVPSATGVRMLREPAVPPHTRQTVRAGARGRTDGLGNDGGSRRTGRRCRDQRTPLGWGASNVAIGVELDVLHPFNLADPIEVVERPLASLLPSRVELRRCINVAAEQERIGSTSAAEVERGQCACHTSRSPGPSDARARTSNRRSDGSAQPPRTKRWVGVARRESYQGSAAPATSAPSTSRRTALAAAPWRAGIWPVMCSTNLGDRKEAAGQEVAEGMPGLRRARPHRLAASTRAGPRAQRRRGGPRRRRLRIQGSVDRRSSATISSPAGY